MSEVKLARRPGVEQVGDVDRAEARGVVEAGGGDERGRVGFRGIDENAELPGRGVAAICGAAGAGDRVISSDRVVEDAGRSRAGSGRANRAGRAVLVQLVEDEVGVALTLASLLINHGHDAREGWRGGGSSANSLKVRKR